MEKNPLTQTQIDVIADILSEVSSLMQPIVAMSEALDSNFVRRKSINILDEAASLAEFLVAVSEQNKRKEKQK